MKLKVRFKKKADQMFVCELISSSEAKKAVKEAWAAIESKRKAKAEKGVYIIVEAPCPLCGNLHRLNVLIRHNGEPHTICMGCGLSKDLREKLKRKGWLPGQVKKKVKRVKVKLT